MQLAQRNPEDRGQAKDRAQASQPGLPTRHVSAGSSSEELADNGKHIVAVVPKGQQMRLRETILGRRSFKIDFFEHQIQAARTLVGDTPDLLLVYDSGFGVDALHLIARSFKEIPFPIVVFTEFTEEEYPDMVSAVMPVEFDLGKFNTKISELLGLPTRSSQRFLVRIGFEMSRKGGGVGSVLANTVNLSESGLLLQCNHELEIGETYIVQFLGFDHLNLPKLHLQIVRADRQTGNGARPKRFAGRFVGESRHAMSEVFGKLVP